MFQEISNFQVNNQCETIQTQNNASAHVSNSPSGVLFAESPPFLGPDIFTPLINRLKTIFNSPVNTQAEKQSRLEDLNSVIDDLDTSYLNFNADMNVIKVTRSYLIGIACNFVKDSLLHGAWTSWASERFVEGLRTLEKSMQIAQFDNWEERAVLGSEKVYQLTRIKHLLTNDKTFETLFIDAGLDSDLKKYSCKNFEKAVTIILNKKELNDRGVNISADSIHKLTEQFNMIAKNKNVLTILSNALKEESNLGKTVERILTTNGSSEKTTPPKKGAPADVNEIAKSFLERFEEVRQDPENAEKININRLLLVAKSIEEFLNERKDNNLLMKS